MRHLLIIGLLMGSICSHVFSKSAITQHTKETLDILKDSYRSHFRNVMDLSLGKNVKLRARKEDTVEKIRHANNLLSLGKKLKAGRKNGAKKVTDDEIIEGFFKSYNEQKPIKLKAGLSENAYNTHAFLVLAIILQGFDHPDDNAISDNPFMIGNRKDKLKTIPADWFTEEKIKFLKDFWNRMGLDEKLDTPINEDNLSKVFAGTETAYKNGYQTESGIRIPKKVFANYQSKSLAYEPLKKVATKNDNTTFMIINGDSIDTALQLKNAGYNPAVLNMANEITPGGGVKHGARAQEEVLCRRSELYDALERHYNSDFKGTEGIDSYFDLIFSKDIMVFRDKDHDFLPHPKTLDFITSAAYNVSGYNLTVEENDKINNLLNESDEETWKQFINNNKGKKLDNFAKDSEEQKEFYFKMTLVRIYNQLYQAYMNGNDSLVLGAFGCGVFNNDPMIMQNMYQAVINKYFNDCFKNITFAVLVVNNSERDKKNFTTFSKGFTETFRKTNTVITLEPISQSYVIGLENDSPLKQLKKGRYKTEYVVQEKETLESGAELFGQGYNPVVLNFANENGPGAAQEGKVVDKLRRPLSNKGQPGMLRAELNDVMNIVTKDDKGFYKQIWAFNTDKAYIPLYGAVYTPTMARLGAHQPPAMAAIACAAPVYSKNLEEDSEKYKKILRNKMRATLLSAQYFGHDSVVLGAWGCGIFGNPPNDIASAYKDILEKEFDGVFKRVIFGIIGSKPNLEAFKKVFNK